MRNYHQAGQATVTRGIRVVGMVAFSMLLIVAVVTKGHLQWYNSFQCRYQCLFMGLPENFGVNRYGGCW